jgi:hypothetical protein
MGTSGQLADHYVEQEAIMLATETFIGKLSRGHGLAKAFNYILKRWEG